MVLAVSAVMAPVEPEVLLEQAVTEKAEPVVLVELQRVVLLAVTLMHMAVPVLAVLVTAQVVLVMAQAVPVTVQAVQVMVPEVSEALVQQDMAMRRLLACIGHEVLAQVRLLVFVPAERLVLDSICL